MTFKSVLSADSITFSVPRAEMKLSSHTFVDITVQLKSEYLFLILNNVQAMNSYLICSSFMSFLICFVEVELNKVEPIKQ